MIMAVVVVLVRVYGLWVCGCGCVGVWVWVCGCVCVCACASAEGAGAGLSSAVEHLRPHIDAVNRGELGGRGLVVRWIDTGNGRDGGIVICNRRESMQLRPDHVGVSAHGTYEGTCSAARMMGGWDV